MQKIFLIIIYLLKLTDTIGQVSSTRQDFFKQRTETIINENKKHNGTIVISDERIKWDTTYWTLKSYLTELDTIDNNDEFRSRQRPTKEIINEFDEVDFQTFKEQIINQYKDSFIKEKSIKGDKGSSKFNRILTVRFSQPLVSRDGDIIVVQEKFDSQYCFTDMIWVYEKVDSKWTKKFEIKKTQLCE